MRTFLIILAAVAAYSGVGFWYVVWFLAQDMVWHWRREEEYPDATRENALWAAVPRAIFWPITLTFAGLSWATHAAAQLVATRLYESNAPGAHRA